MRAPSLVAGLALTVLAMTAAVGGASNWCDQTLIAFAPTEVPAERDVTFTVQVHNTGGATLTLSSVRVQFPWEGTYREAGSGSVGPGATAYYTTTARPPQGNQAAVEVTISGTSSQDPGGSAEVTCSTTFRINATSSTHGDPGFEAPALAVALLAAAMGIGVRRR
jgi:hypothetical protein